MNARRSHRGISHGGRRRLGTAIGAVILAAGLVTASAVAAPPRAATIPTAETSQVGADDIAPLASWDVVKWYDVKGLSSNAALRVGTSSWGYTHLLRAGRCPAPCGWFDKHVTFALQNWNSVQISGTSYTYLWREIVAGAYLNWRVVVEWGNHQGIITAYNDRNIYGCVSNADSEEH